VRSPSEGRSIFPCEGVGQDDEVAACVERLARPEELAREIFVRRGGARAAVPCMRSTGSPEGAPTVV